MFDPDVVVRMLAAVGGAKPEVLVAVSEVDDFLGTAVALIPQFFLQPQRAEHREVEGERLLHVANRQVDVVNPAGGNVAPLASDAALRLRHPTRLSLRGHSQFWPTSVSTNEEILLSRGGVRLRRLVRLRRSVSLTRPG